MRRAVRVLLIVAALGVLMGVGAILGSQTAYVKRWLRDVAVRQAGQHLDGTLTIGRVDGNLFFGVVLEDVELRMDDAPVLSIPRVVVTYDPLRLASRAVVINSIHVHHPVVRLGRDERGWGIGRIVRERAGVPPAQGGEGRTVRIERIEIFDGEIVIGASPDTLPLAVPRRINDLDAEMTVVSGPAGHTLEIRRLSLETVSPALRLAALSGRLAVAEDALVVERLAARTPGSSVTVDGRVESFRSDPRVELRARVETRSLDELGRFVPAFAGIGLAPSMTLAARGPASALEANLTLRSSAGEVAVDLVADLTAPEPSAKGEARVTGVDLAPVLRDPGSRTDLGGEIAFDLRHVAGAAGLPVAGTVQLSSSRLQALGYEARQVRARASIEGERVAIDARAEAYGAAVTASGTLHLGGGRARTVPVFDVRGVVENGDLARLPRALGVPPVPARLDLDYHVAGDGKTFSGDARLRQSMLAGAMLAEDATASFSLGPGVLEYTFAGDVTGIDLQQVGHDFGLEALEAGLFRSAVNGWFDVRGSGREPGTVRLDAKGTLRDSRLFEADVPGLRFEAALADRRLTTHAEGSVRGVDPAVVTGSAAAQATLNGTFDVRASLDDVTAPDPLGALGVSGRVTLEPSSARGLAIDRAEVRGRYAGGRAEVDECVVTGPAVEARMNGHLVLDDRGDSALNYQLTSSDLARAAEAFGWALRGTAAVEGTVTGNRTLLTTNGLVTAQALGHAEHGAERAEVRFTATLPDFDLPRARLQADADVKAVTAAGNLVDTIRASATYRAHQLAFETTLAQQARRVDAAGRLELGAERQDLYLESAVVSFEGGEWRLLPESAPRIEFGPGRVVLEGIRFVSGAQQLAVDGILDAKASHVRAQAVDIDLARLNPLLPDGPALAGRLNAIGSASGPSRDLTVAGEFSVAQGAIDDFQMERFGGRLGFSYRMLSLDVRLDQAAGVWVEARGSLPAAFFFAVDHGGTEAEAGASDGLDLTIETSPVPSAIFERLFEEVENVAGTLQVDARVAGSVRRPRITGFVDVRDGAFTVVPTGVAYRGLDTRIRFEGDRIVLDGLRLVDQQGQALSVTGRIALRERSVGDVNLAIEGRRFTVSDNDLAALRVDSDLRIVGDIRGPVVSGSISVGSSTIQVDRLLDLLAAALADAPGAPAVDRQAPAGVRATAAGAGAGVFDSATLDVTIDVDDNLLLRGTDLRVGPSLVGLGDVNVTVGGQVKVQKLPFAPPALLGEIRAVRGTYDFQGRRFDIVRESGLRFQGVSPIDPLLNLSASRVISGVQTNVLVQGSARNPELRLSSVPPLDEADILSLIVFNQPANELGTGQQVSLAERAGLLATGFVTSRLAQSINQVLDLDVFEIQAVAEPGVGRGATITIGEQVGERLYFRLRQAIGEANMSQFVLEFKLADNARLETTVTQGQSITRSLLQRLERGGIDLIVFFSY